MRKIVGTIALALLVSSCGGGGGKVESAPKPLASLAMCPTLTPLEKAHLARTQAVTIPPQTVGSILASNAQNLAVARLGGGTTCVDVRLMRNAAGFETLQGDRFLSFDWQGFQDQGYRSDGHKLVDRATGQVLETGGKPVFSPSGQLFAAAYQSETAFAGLDGFGVWRVSPNGAIPVAKVDDLPEMLDWRVDSWGGETCVNLSAVSFSSVTIGTKDFSAAPRERYIARQTGVNWSVDEAKGKSCP